ncbi:unnamed protein product [Pleuronectes platessa]|uniref:Uncharacterized protein n=1 Tax=Pleuronectes platessa TaxID=8262 RepID=A0A9N7YA93_PLEPL|nr:unnamed protein product [Pleuronectes platessa]
MDNKSKKRPGGAEKHREKKLKSLEVEAARCAKLTDLFGAGFTSPAAAGAPGDERGGLDNDERVEADMVMLVGGASATYLPNWVGRPREYKGLLSWECLSLSQQGLLHQSDT